MRINSLLFVKTLVLFVLTQLLGIFVALKILPAIELPTPRNLTDFSVTGFLTLAAALVLFFFLSSRFPRFGSIVYRIFLTLIIFSMTQLVTDIWLSPVNSTLVALFLVIMFWLLHSVLLQDLVMIVTLAGIGAIFGLMLTPLAVVFILVVLSFYDIIAVYKTGHMVRLAQMMIQSRAIFGFVIPSASTGFGASMKAVQPGEEFSILGSGDVALPLILAVSLVRISLTQSLIVIAFAAVGLLITHLLFVNQKSRRPMAALPPIAAASIIGYLTTSLF